MAKGKAIKTKNEFRTFIKDLKAKYTSSQLEEMSGEIFSVVELTGAFQKAKTVFIYNSLPDEVSTQEFIKKWGGEKRFFLPSVCNDALVFKEYTSNTVLKAGVLGIREPVGDAVGSPKADDLIIVPGLAFDRTLNRLGRGKGFYDRFLSTAKGVKMGVCFDFQLADAIPFDDNDVKMDILVSENDLIW